MQQPVLRLALAVGGVASTAKVAVELQTLLPLVPSAVRAAQASIGTQHTHSETQKRILVQKMPQIKLVCSTVAHNSWRQQRSSTQQRSMPRLLAAARAGRHN